MYPLKDIPNLYDKWNINLNFLLKKEEKTGKMPVEMHFSSRSSSGDGPATRPGLGPFSRRRQEYTGSAERRCRVGEAKRMKL